MFLRKSVNRKNDVSIDEPLNVDWDGNELLLSDVLGTENDTVYQNVEQEAEQKLLDTIVDGLNSRERIIIELRFGLGGKAEHTQKEVADIIGISQSYISRLEKRIINKLKREIEIAEH
jgi:RNA polymerase sporulation-specific sigma factor